MRQSTPTLSPGAWATDAARTSAVSRAKALIFLAAGISLAMAVALFFGGDPEQGLFVGLWVPSILSAGALLMGGRS